jgi:hypothetical protein
MTGAEKPRTAFVLSLIAGIFILLGAGVMIMLRSWMGNYGYGMVRGYGRYGGMMGQGFGTMDGPGYGLSLLGVVGLIFGAIVIISAVMLNSRPQQHTTWGILVIIFSVLSIFASVAGGFGVGLILGIVGGALALTWKPSAVAATPAQS